MSRFLLDTHAFLWWPADAPQLGVAASEVISDPANECYLSVASCWEMAIKSSLGKLKLAKPVEKFVSEHIAANNFSLLGIEFRHVARVQKMPFHHRDPFDRLLLAQAMTEKLTLLTADSAFSNYGVDTIW